MLSLVSALLTTETNISIHTLCLPRNFPRTEPPQTLRSIQQKFIRNLRFKLLGGKNPSSAPWKLCFASCHWTQRHFTVTALQFLKQQEQKEKCICWESKGDEVSQAEQIAPVPGREAFPGLACNDFTPSPSHAGFFFSTSLYCCCTDSVGPVVSSVPLSRCFNAATTQRPRDPLTQAWVKLPLLLSSFHFSQCVCVCLSPYILAHSYLPFHFFLRLSAFSYMSSFKNQGISANLV